MDGLATDSQSLDVGIFNIHCWSLIVQYKGMLDSIRGAGPESFMLMRYFWQAETINIAPDILEHDIS